MTHEVGKDVIGEGTKVDQGGQGSKRDEEGENSTKNKFCFKMP